MCDPSPNPAIVSKETPSEPAVFVIDDDASVRKGLARLLRAADYKSEIFESASDFLKREQYTGPTCVIVDVRMPGLNGMDLQATLAGSFTFTIWRPPGMKSSRCPLVACSDVMGSSVTDILGAAEALAPAVIGADPGNGSQSKTGTEILTPYPPPPGGAGSAPDPISKK